jgi:hypothetical protein
LSQGAAGGRLPYFLRYIYHNKEVQATLACNHNKDKGKIDQEQDEQPISARQWMLASWHTIGPHPDRQGERVCNGNRTRPPVSAARLDDTIFQRDASGLYRLTISRQFQRGTEQYQYCQDHHVNDSRSLVHLAPKLPRLRGYS